MEVGDRGNSGSGSGLLNGNGGGGAGAGDGSVEVVKAKNVNASKKNNAESMNLPNIAESGGVNVAGAVSVAGGIGSVNGDLRAGKKKRGRPRKYDSNGNLHPSYIKPLPPPQLQPNVVSPTNRRRGQPSSSASPTPTWPILASLGEVYGASAGREWTPHVVTVNTGEDIAGKILTFAQKGHCRICVLSANGSVSNVTLGQPGSSSGGRVVTYEGEFDILNLMGSYVISEKGGMRSLAGGLKISLVTGDGHIIGGSVAGLLIAANPVQMVIGSFVPNGFKVRKTTTLGAKHQKGPSVPYTYTPVTFTARMPPMSQAVAGANGSSIPSLQLQLPWGQAENTLAKNKAANSTSSNGAAVAQRSGSRLSGLDKRP